MAGAHSWDWPRRPNWRWHCGHVQAGTVSLTPGSVPVRPFQKIGPERVLVTRRHGDAIERPPLEPGHVGLTPAPLGQFSRDLVPDSGQVGHTARFYGLDDEDVPTKRAPNRPDHLASFGAEHELFDLAGQLAPLEPT